MRKILLVAFAVAIVSLGVSAYAQIPFVVVSFDESPYKWSTDCPPVAVAETFTVWAFNFGMWINAVAYMIAYCPAVAFLGDVLPPGVLQIGSSPLGIAISYPIPANAFGPPFPIQGVSVFWNCTDCNGPPSYWDCPVIVRPHPGSGKILVTRWPDYATVEIVGMTSIICPLYIPVQETTWGQVKSLYSD